uniref:Uncharacterized protein n=1 Tax=Tanacetum cinerariifolium TaxID=118510 RepID=A0A6L2JS18_TANCI|nr:hypothetical protein [Tanacetum cinerariifolium]
MMIDNSIHIRWKTLKNDIGSFAIAISLKLFRSRKFSISLFPSGAILLSVLLGYEKASRSVGNKGGKGNGKMSKPTWFSRLLHGDSCDDSSSEVCKESKSNTNDEFVLAGSSCGNTNYGNYVIPSKELNAIVNKLEASYCEFEGMHIDEQNAIIGEINILWDKYLASGFSNPINTDGPGPDQSVTILKKISFSEAVGASTKMDLAANTHNAKGDNTILSHDTPIVQLASIQEPILDLKAADKPNSYVYAGVAGVSAKDQPKVTPNFHPLVADPMFNCVNISIPRKVVKKRLTQKDSNGTRIDSGFKRAFATLFGQDIEIFTGTLFLNVEQLEKQLDKEDFQEIGSMAAFNYTKLAIPEFRDTLIQHMESIKKSIDERAQHKREYDSWLNERLMQTSEAKVETSKALDASLVDIESSGTESKEHDTRSRLGNDAHDDDADIRPIYDEEPMAKVQTTAKINIFSIGQHHAEQPKFNNKGEVDQNAEQCHDTWKPMLQSHRNQLVIRQPTAFKSERPRISKPQFASQVDVINDLSKPVTTHYLPKEREVASAKPHHMIAFNNYRISLENMPRFSLNDMIYNHYLKEAKKKTQERCRNLEPSLMPPARS